jgi:pSer/pThr/pTyr-binding forkhead associated (FHA) protein
MEDSPSLSGGMLLSEMSSHDNILELLDSEGGKSMYVWELQEQETFLIGRSRDCTIVLANPYVSRSHETLRKRETDWELTANSPQGLIVAGKREDRALLTDGMEFRLGPQGPWLRFRLGVSPKTDESMSTMSFDPTNTPLLVLDADQMSREVESIVEGDYFALLQKMAAQLKDRSSQAGRPVEPASSQPPPTSLAEPPTVV